MASATPATPSTKETTNYARLCRVLVDVGTCALRDCFDAICLPPTLNTVLAASQPVLHSFRSRRIINATQWGKLFPAVPASVSSRDFDITLLIILLRNICGLAPPLTGWDALPATTDVSREADIARVKYFRNTVYGHAEHASVDDATFNKHWKEIRDTLVRLGGVTYEVAIDNLEVCCMDPDMECHYKNLLHQWKNDEDTVKDELKKIGSDVEEFSTGIIEIGTNVKNLSKKLDDLVAATMIPAREANDEGNGLRLKEILDTTLVCREKFHENEPLTSFCNQCKVCICNKCRQTRHNNHPTEDIHQAAEQHKVDIEEIVQEMKREIAEYKEHLEKTRESFKRSRERIASARNKVMTSVEELVRLLKEHEKAMITSLDVIEGKEQREQAAQLEHFQCSMNQLQKHIEWWEDILLRQNSVEILQAHHTLVGRCRGLLNSDKLNIYKPPHIRYQTNKEHDDSLRDAIPALGRVVGSSTDPLQSVAEGTGLKEGEVGREASFKITTKDSAGKQCYDVDDYVHVKVQSPSGEELTNVIVAGKDGEYSVTYTPDCDGQHDVLVAVNCQPLSASPWRVHVEPHSYKSVVSFNLQGKEKRQFNPLDIAIHDKLRNVAVADYWNGVHLVKLEGTCHKVYKTHKLTIPTAVAFSRSGELIVIASKKIFRFNENDKFIGYVTKTHLREPKHLTIARDGCMVVCDWGDHAVKVLSSDGSQLLLTISDPDSTCPWLSVCHQNMFFVSYPVAGCVKVFSEDGGFLRSIGMSESDDGQLTLPLGLAIDRFNNLVVCDYVKRRLQIFTVDGKFVNTIEGQHTGLCEPYSVAVSSTGQLFVTDVDRNRLHIFQ